MPAANIGIPIVGLDIEKMRHCKANQLSGQDKQLSTSVFNFNKIFSISSGCGQTEFYFPA